MVILMKVVVHKYVQIALLVFICLNLKGDLCELTTWWAEHIFKTASSWLNFLNTKTCSMVIVPKYFWPYECHSGRGHVHAK